jgi:general secretion pathway protein G
MTQTILTGSKKGFSLLELLIVVGIIAALVGLAMPYYQDYVGQSKNSIMRGNLHLLKKTLMEYKADKGEFPAALTDLVPKYLMELPVDPEDNAVTDWGYTRSGDKQSYTLNSKYNL